MFQQFQKKINSKISTIRFSLINPVEESLRVSGREEKEKGKKKKKRKMKRSPITII